MRKKCLEIRVRVGGFATKGLGPKIEVGPRPVAVRIIDHQAPRLADTRLFVTHDASSQRGEDANPNNERPPGEERQRARELRVGQGGEWANRGEEDRKRKKFDEQKKRGPVHA